jgi:hypothetical protein
MNEQKAQKIELVLNSLDNCSKASAPDFFYTRLKARMERTVEPANIRSLYFRPAVVMGLLVFLVTANTALMIDRQINVSETLQADTDYTQSMAIEYKLQDNGNIYDVNQDRTVDINQDK